MQYFNVPSSLKEVFGEKQTSIEVAATLISSLSVCLIIYCFLYPSNDNNHIAVIFDFVLVWDVLLISPMELTNIMQHEISLAGYSLPSIFILLPSLGCWMAHCIYLFGCGYLRLQEQFRLTYCKGKNYNYLLPLTLFVSV